MNKMKLVETVAKDLGISAAKAGDVVDAVLDAIVRTTVAGDKVAVTGFGTFETVKTAPRKARNPQTGERIQVPATARVRFRPGQQYADYAAGRTPLPAGRAVKKAPKGSKTGGGK